MTNFTNEQLEALLEPYPARPRVMGNAKASYSNSYSDTYVISAWEKKCDVILKRREHAAPALAATLLAERKAREVEQKELERYKAFIFEPNYLETSAAKAIRNYALGPSDNDGHLYLYDLIPEEWCSPNRLVVSDEMAERLADVAIGQWIVDARQALKGQRDE